MLLPTFFNYNDGNQTDNGCETLQDFYLSWTLRCSQKQYENENKKVYDYSREIIYILIKGGEGEINEPFKFEFNTPESFEVNHVKVYRQFKRIDLIVEIEYIENGIDSKLILNIENKWYTQIKDKQLKSALTAISLSEKFKKLNCINLVVYLDNENIRITPKQKEICFDNNYKYLSIEDLKNILNLKVKIKTGNQLFDDYWLN